MALLVRGDSVPTWAPAVRQNGYLATSDLPKVLDNVANVLYLDAYTEAPRTFTAWTRELEVPDFRTAVVVTPSFPALLPVPEHAEFAHHGALGPTAALRLMTYGRQVTVTRQAVLADDMLTFGQLQQALGVAAAACESDAVYNLLTSNPTMADGNALFSVAHGNLMAAADLTAASLATASAALAAQTTADGRALHLAAKYLVVGTLLGAETRQLVTTMTPANTPPARSKSAASAAIRSSRACARPRLIAASFRATTSGSTTGSFSWPICPRLLPSDPAARAGRLIVCAEAARSAGA